MVDYCVGTVVYVEVQEVVVDVGSLGISLQVPLGKQFTQGAQAKIYCCMHWSSENGPALFGFAQKLERSVFKIIIGCSGIGPKIGLAILADLGADSFLHAISTENDQMLSKVNGIGKKKAEQIIVHLKHKVATLLETGAVSVDAMQGSSHLHDVSQALVTLNYSRSEINNAMDFLRKNSKVTENSFDYLLRQALAYLSKQL
jgi:Holliday junction DNA helicase RuvA